MRKRINAIAELIRLKITEADNGSYLKTIKKVYEGDPIIIPKSNLPAVTIRALGSTVTARGNMQDNRVEKYQIRLVFNVRDTFGNSNNNTVEWELQATDFFMQEKEDSSELSENCIVSLLRKNLQLGNTQLQENLQIKNEYSDIRDYLAFESSLEFDILSVCNR